MQRSLDEGTVPLAPHQREEILEVANGMAGSALRVLAFAYQEVASTSTSFSPEALEQDLIFAGLVGIMDPPRPEVAEALRRCHDAGIRVLMITGDHRLTAMAIGREIGLISGEAPILAGEEMEQLSNGELAEVLARGCQIFARTTPRQKLRIVSVLKDMGEIVAVTGDGVNDGPALKHADIGIAMGMTGTDVAREASQMVLLDDNFATIVAAIEEGRAVFENIRKFITYIFTSNIPEIVPYLAFVLFGIPLPLTIIQILAIDLGTDMLPALALGAEPPAGDTMRAPPRPRGEPLLTSAMLAACLCLSRPHRGRCRDGRATSTSYSKADGHGGRRRRAAVPPGDHRLPDRGGRDASRQWLRLPQPSCLHLLSRPVHQPTAAGRHAGGGRPAAGHRVLPYWAEDLRDGCAAVDRLAGGPALRTVPVRGR